MTWRDLFGVCAFGHAVEPLIVRVGKETRWECRRCCADLGPMLAGQKYKARKVVTRKRKSAAVLSMAKRQAS